MALPLRDDRQTRRTPWATYGLLVANVVVFLFLQPAWFQGGQQSSFSNPRGRVEAERFIYKWGAVPCEVRHLESLADGPSCDEDQPSAALVPTKSVLASLFTHMFLHASLTHLAGNMLFLWVFGRAVEDRTGPLPFLGLYLVTGLAGVLGHILLHLHSAQPTLGASGAIAGIMGAYLVLRPRGRILTVVYTAAFQVVYVPAFVVLGLFFVTQFFTPASAHVAWVAHAAGMGAGMLLAFPLKRWFADPEKSGFCV